MNNSFRSRHYRDFIIVFDQRVGFGKLPVDRDLHPAIGKRLLPAGPAPAQPRQQGFDIGHRLWQYYIFFILARYFRQLDEIQQLDADLAIFTRGPAFATVQAETGGDFVHPYNDPRVIAGQGTCSKEFIEQTDGLDMVVAPIGGGGMISGTCLTLSNLAPETKVIAAEPEQADDAYRSFKAGHIIADDAPKTIADGLLVPLKDLTWHFVSSHVSEIYTASEQEIIDAMKLTWKHLRVVMEPSSAVPLATILKNAQAFKGKRVGVIITGGNVDLDKLPWLSS